jgi:hypothetical protein
VSTDVRATDASDASQRVVDLADSLAQYYQRYEADHDARAVFAFSYCNLTRGLAARLADPESGFDDPDWVADLACVFGRRYMAAMDELDQWQRTADGVAGDPDSLATLDADVARPWADVYRAICLERSTVLEDLLYGIYAHISYDLPFALLEVDTDVDRLADYHLMNEVLATHTELIQSVVTARYDRLLSRADRVAGTADEFFTNYGIRVARSVAWYNGMRLQSEASREATAASIERSTAAFIDSVRRPRSRVLLGAFSFARYLSSVSRRWPTPQAEATDADVLVRQLAGP